MLEEPGQDKDKKMRFSKSQVVILPFLELLNICSAFIPNVTNIALIANTSDNLELIVMEYAIKAINKDAKILPNTTLKALNVSFTADNAFENINSLMQSDVIGLFEATGTGLASAIPANMLQASLFKLGQDNCDKLYQTEYDASCDHSVVLRPSLKTVNNAVIGFMAKTNITAAVLLYDVRRSKQVSDFIDSSKKTMKTYHLIFLNFEKDVRLSSHSLKDLQGLRKLKTKTVILFVEPGKTELIMEIVNLHCSCVTGSESILWILPIVNSSTYNANPLDKVVGFRLQIRKTSTYFKLLEHVAHDAKMTAISELPESAALLYDAVMATANAISNVISRGEWSASNISEKNGLFPNRTKNAEKINKELQSITFAGMTESFTISTNQSRNVTQLDILNLKNDKFYKIGSFSTENEVSLTGKVEQNRRFASIQIAHKTLKVVAMEQKPFVFVKETGNETEFSGFSYDLLQRLSTSLNFKFEIHLSKTKNLASAMETMDADVILNPIVISANHQKTLSFTKPFMQFSIGLLTKKENEKELDLTQFMLPFTIPAWCLLVSSCIFVTIMVYLLDKYSPYGWRQNQQAQGEEGDEFSFFNSLWFCFACMLTQGADNTPRNLSGRILTGSFWVCVLIWNATYTANLASFLVLTNSALPVTSLDNAVTKGYKMALVQDSAVAHLFNISSNSLHQKVWNNAKQHGYFVESHDKGAMILRKQDKVAFIAEQPFLKHYKGQKECNLVMVKNVLHPMSFAFALPLSSKYADSMSLGILKLQEKGVVESFERKWWTYQNQCPDVKQTVSQSRMGVNEMLGVYLVLIAGIVISIVSVGMEIWWQKSLGAKVKGILEKRKRFFSSKVADASK